MHRTEAQLVVVYVAMNSWGSHFGKTCNIMQHEEQQLIQEELRHYWCEKHNKLEACEARLVKRISELKSHLEDVTSNSETWGETLITSDFGQASQGLQSYVYIWITDMFTVHSGAPVIKQSTDTDTSVATSIVMTPVVSSSNQLLTHYHTPDVILHDVSDVLVTSVISPLTQIWANHA